MQNILPGASQTGKCFYCPPLLSFSHFFEFFRVNFSPQIIFGVQLIQNYLAPIVQAKANGF